MRRFFVMVLIVLIFGALGYAAGSFFRNGEPGLSNNLDDGKTGNGEPDPAPEIRTATFAAVGDMFPHMAQITQAHLGGDQYDFTPGFEYIKPYLQEADFATVNLETNQAGADRVYGGFELGFNAPIQLSEALRDSGVDLYATATNHVLDRGLDGLKATLENVRALGIITTGTFLSQEERDTPVIVDINGINVAFISYTYGTNGIPIPAGHEYAVNLVEDFQDITPVIDDIKSARAAGADIVTVFPHWGPMYVHEPPAELREKARELAAAGADLIICGHAHGVQPMEWIYTEQDSGAEGPTLVAYSLGNFFTNQHYPALDTDMVEYGLLLNIELSKDMSSNEAWISDADYEVHWCHFQWRHRILVLSEVFEKGPGSFNISADRYETLKRRYEDNVEIVERYGFSQNLPWKQ